eukprot:CAMPEP_0171086652 /NCGR_PEP_ID=MMETSP0766_2-20121228/19675_1 /TAXON_ID=439317 /ORGANISM="Gambierdiscus australes, Strain CAWD 149" /LENGTH=149 /DNA_ID=CAMNT_0011544311 /DNA_START=99 /DNA_END=545 /DNA_ORIENTATION=+
MRASTREDLIMFASKRQAPTSQEPDMHASTRRSHSLPYVAAHAPAAAQMGRHEPSTKELIVPASSPPHEGVFPRRVFSRPPNLRMGVMNAVVGAELFALVVTGVHCAAAPCSRRTLTPVPPHERANLRMGVMGVDLIALAAGGVHCAAL